MVAMIMLGGIRVAAYFDSGSAISLVSLAWLEAHDVGKHGGVPGAFRANEEVSSYVDLHQREVTSPGCFLGNLTFTGEQSAGGGASTLCKKGELTVNAAIRIA